MSYKDLLKSYIDESKLSHREISRRVKALGTSVSQPYISQLINGDAPPASEEINRALAQVTGGDPEKLSMTAYLEKAPDAVRDELSKVITKENFEASRVRQFLTWEEFKKLREIRNKVVHSQLNDQDISVANKYIALDCYAVVELVISGYGDFSDEDLRHKFNNARQILADPQTVIDYHLITGKRIKNENHVVLSESVEPNNNLTEKQKKLLELIQELSTEQQDMLLKTWEVILKK